MGTKRKTCGDHFFPLRPALFGSLVLDGYKESSRKIIFLKNWKSNFVIGYKAIVESNANHVAVPALAFLYVRYYFCQRNYRNFKFLDQSHLLLEILLRYRINRVYVVFSRSFAYIERMVI